MTTEADEKHSDHALGSRVLHQVMQEIVTFGRGYGIGVRTGPAQRGERNVQLGHGAVTALEAYDVAGENVLRSPVPLGEPA